MSGYTSRLPSTVIALERPYVMSAPLGHSLHCRLSPILTFVIAVKDSLGSSFSFVPSKVNILKYEFRALIVAAIVMLTIETQLLIPPFYGCRHVRTRHAM
ncbi:hypothetical protein QL285_068160 [Trifolium repens]|jgi:hypothetical protein|nr:hypothetical protein QL285_068160 [Trifolium repens]